MQYNRFKTLLWILAAACLLGACQPEMIPIPPAAAISTPTLSAPGPAAAATSVPVKQFTPAALPTDPVKTMQETPMLNAVPVPTPLDAPMQAIVTQVKTDLAKRLSIDAGQIELVELSFVTWPDGSLGCPKPGMAYTQALVDGLLIRVKAGGQVYEYHSGGSKSAFLCK